MADGFGFIFVVVFGFFFAGGSMVVILSLVFVCCFFGFFCFFLVGLFSEFVWVVCRCFCYLVGWVEGYWGVVFCWVFIFSFFVSFVCWFFLVFLSFRCFFLWFFVFVCLLCFFEFVCVLALYFVFSGSFVLCFFVFCLFWVGCWGFGGIFGDYFVWDFFLSVIACSLLWWGGASVLYCDLANISRVVCVLESSCGKFWAGVELCCVRVRVRRFVVVWVCCSLGVCCLISVVGFSWGWVVICWAYMGCRFFLWFDGLIFRLLCIFLCFVCYKWVRFRAWGV